MPAYYYSTDPATNCQLSDVWRVCQSNGKLSLIHCMHQKKRGFAWAPLQNQSQAHELYRFELKPNLGSVHIKQQSIDSYKVNMAAKITLNDPSIFIGKNYINGKWLPAISGKTFSVTG